MSSLKLEGLGLLAALPPSLKVRLSLFLLLAPPHHDMMTRLTCFLHQCLQPRLVCPMRSNPLRGFMHRTSSEQPDGWYIRKGTCRS